MLKNVTTPDLLGIIAVIVGILLVVSGARLQDDAGVGFGGSVRTIGGLLVLGGLAAILFVDSRRRGAILGAAMRVPQRYIAATAHWEWRNRVGLACIGIGLVLLAPALLLQALFGDPFGSMVMWPGIVIFFTGVALLVWPLVRPLLAWLYRREVRAGYSSGRSSGGYGGGSRGSGGGRDSGSRGGGGGRGGGSRGGGDSRR